MKKLIALTLLSSVSTITLAGTMGEAKAPMLTNGLYAGIGIGANSLDFNTSTNLSGPRVSVNAKEKFGVSAVLGDVFGGYNYKFTPLINVGLEVFYSFYNLKNTLTAGIPDNASNYKSNYNYGIRLLPGINLMTNARLFGAVGATSGHFTYLSSNEAQRYGSPSHFSKNLTGLILGLGTDVALTSKLSIRGLYQNISYGTWSFTTPITIGVNKTQFKNQENQFIASLLYHFG
jgi:opacity protein-like surface antigen